jgi:hypothetical protein
MRRTVDDYIERQPSPQKEICRELRKIIIDTFPGIMEEIKMGVPWYEGRFYIVGLTDHVNLGVSLAGLSKDDVSLLQGGGKTMKHLAFSSPGEINRDKIVELLQKVKKKS